MILQGSEVNIIDNSGAKKAECIKVLGNNKKVARIGDIIKVSIKKSKKHNKIAPGSIYNALIVKTKYPQTRADGTSIAFTENGAILLNDKLEIICTRVKRTISKEIRFKNISKILSITKHTI
ncbi:50S ribosomal protein L14 [Candidatus Vidania fulgoroideae]|uniref:Large ribosomal subunit protein uL14 n=1 Tax=Candidatus Vidania fulgoroideorum TaxID=881286 RepID=A0A975AED0_9PROT|nr:50S ribosomal protein L14 [Candidatus Vidania fulgoroideae]